ncbi:unnamed protein product [Didymodactylos carnosus]|uniref:NHL repeat-containing protein n=1 Tax=Didymodactylos carnosus TaxID=1234261 RepID=A0A8S2UK37_9BILA|nr:unnamed protein product [Didymodactylos carnosus]CAF4348680.1 unnamed protein product [Didymodactylos carnosus]
MQIIFLLVLIGIITAQNSCDFNWSKIGVTVAGGNGQGNKNFQLNIPTAIYLNPKFELLYISNSVGNSLIKWKPSAEHGTFLVKPNSEQLKFPNGLALDLYGNIYVMDSGNARIQQFCQTSQDEGGRTIVGPTKEQLVSPFALAIDLQLNLYVTDVKLNQVLQFKRLLTSDSNDICKYKPLIF